MSTNSYTWATRPSPGTLVRFTYSRVPHYFDSAGKRDWVDVKRGEVAMVVGEFREHYPDMHPPVTVDGLRLILSCGMVVLFNVVVSSISGGTGEQHNSIGLEAV